MKYNLERFQGNRRVVEVADGATKGATVGVDLFYNGVVVLWEDIYNGGASGGTPTTPGTTITAWSLILDIPPNVLALASIATTGVYVITGAGTSVTRTITGVTNRTTVTSGNGVSGNPTVDIAATYAGQSSITTLGTVTTGSWNGTAIAAPYGGTGQSVYTVGDILYASAANALSKLAAGTATHVLTSNGPGLAPSWQAGGGGGGSGVWGSITGTITAQTDLMQRFATASLLDTPFL